MSGTLIVLSVLWMISALVFHHTNRRSHDGIFGAPVWTLLLLTEIPLITVLIVILLLRDRDNSGERVRGIDYCALLAALVPLAGIWVLIATVM